MLPEHIGTSVKRYVRHKMNCSRELYISGVDYKHYVLLAHSRFPWLGSVVQIVFQLIFNMIVVWRLYNVSPSMRMLPCTCICMYVLHVNHAHVHVCMCCMYIILIVCTIERQHIKRCLVCVIWSHHDTTVVALPPCCRKTRTNGPTWFR